MPGGTEDFASDTGAPAADSDQLGVTLDEMIALSGLSPDEFQETYLSWVDVEATHFQLYKRARHVFDEAWRVLEFRDVCAGATAGGQVSAASCPTCCDTGR
jgi:hypothetical protein